MAERFPQAPILLIDDDEAVLEMLEWTLRAGGYTHLRTCSAPRTAASLVGAEDYALVLLDLLMPGQPGEDLLSRFTEKQPEVPVVVVTAVDDLHRAVACMRQGAADYLVKPVDRELLLTTVRRILDADERRREAEAVRDRLLSGRLRMPEAFAPIRTREEAMFRLFEYVEAIAPTRQPVLLLGESGTGKELLARALHEASGRRGGFVAVNVAGLDDTVFADTLFGHLPGAYTGARDARAGLVEEAEDGTLFLDEIGDLAPPSQVKLLRLLQEGEYFPLGADTSRRSRARIVGATHQDPQNLRRDLYFRLKGHRVVLPPLRKRPADISLLFDQFLEEASREYGRTKARVPESLLASLTAYDFPGNVRELRSMVFDAVARHRRGRFPIAPFEEALARARQRKGPPASSDHRSPVEDGALPHRDPERVRFPPRLPTLKECERLLVDEALRRTEGNRSAAARLLGISRQALHRRLQPREEEE